MKHAEKFILLIILIFNFGNRCHSFNIDTTRPLIFKGKEKSHFGYASGLLRNSQGLWLLVGSPRDNFTDRPEIISPGNVYKCPINITTTDQRNCEPIRLRSLESTRGDSTYPYEESGQLLGASVLIAGNNVVLCAPLWKDVTDALASDGVELLPGYCYQMDTSLVENTIKRRRFYPQIFNDITYVEGKVMTGFSSSISQVPNLDFVLGLPGVMRDIGGIALCNPTGNRFRDFYKPIGGHSNRQIQENFLQGRGSYIGYAVASGYFGPARKALIVASAPHFSNANGHIGSVLLLDVTIGALSNSMTPVKVLEGHQIGALYGASLLVVDVNGDDIDDLLVGSPQYHMVLSALDQGEVTVYHGTGDGTYVMEQTRLYGLPKPFSRFGTALASLGDITGDNFNDIVIGAPFEDGMTGAIYIFNGGVNGTNPRFSQRISGEKILPGIKTFGWHLSQAMDIDNNLHDDIAVGAYMSDMVVTVRSRPVVTVFSNMTVTPAVVPLVPNNSYCMGQNGMPCVTIHVCFSYTARGLNNGVYINYELKADSKRLQNRLSGRMNLFLEDNDVNRRTVLNQRILIPASGAVCKTIFGRVQTLTREFYRVIGQNVVFSLNQSLSETQSVGEITPILNIGSDKEKLATVRFQRECENECMVDLSIDIKSSKAITVGENNEENVEVEVHNKGDTSYASSLYINTSNNTAVLGIQLLQGSKQLECVIANVSDVGLRCDVVQPLRRGNIVHFMLRLDTSLPVLLPSGWIQDLDSAINISGRVISTALASKEIDNGNNGQTIQVPVQVQSDVQMSGASQPEQRKSQNTDVDIVHMYEIYNAGPSQLPVTEAVFYIPVKSQSGLALIEKSKLKAKSENIDVKCTVTYDTKLNGSSMQTTTSNPSTVTRPPRSRSLTTNDRTSTNITCKNYECARIQCNLPEIIVNGRINIKIEFTITEGNLDFKTTDVSISFRSDGTLYQPRHIRMVPWQSGKITSQVQTTFFPEVISPSTTKLNIGIIIGGCIGGLVPFIILGIILWKCGFFKREKQKEAQELKRQSMAIQKRRTQMMVDAALSSSKDGIVANETPVDIEEKQTE